MAAASTSAFTIRPPGPVPWSCASSSPSSRAIRRATGDAFVRPPLPPSDGSGARAGASSASSVGAVAAALLALGGRGLRLGLAGLLLAALLRLGLGSSWAADAPSLPPPICAIVSPTASVSPSWATIFSAPSWSAS